MVKWREAFWRCLLAARRGGVTQQERRDSCILVMPCLGTVPRTRVEGTASPPRGAQQEQGRRPPRPARLRASRGPDRQQEAARESNEPASRPSRRQTTSEKPRRNWSLRLSIVDNAASWETRDASILAWACAGAY